MIVMDAETKQTNTLVNAQLRAMGVKVPTPEQAQSNDQQQINDKVKVK